MRGRRIIAVNDAHRLLPFADILYACDAAWWNMHKGVREFGGERWSSHGLCRKSNDKSDAARDHGLLLVAGRDSHEGFSLDPDCIHYGSNSGFQAVNMAILLGATRIILVGFDMRGTHFFGKHPKGLRNATSFVNFIRAFERAAKYLPKHITILNATPGSALRCFPMVDLHVALASAAA